MKNALFAVLFIPTIANAGYIGSQIGLSALDADTAGASVVHDRTGTLSIFFGKQLQDNFAIEGGFTNLGEFFAYYPAYDEFDDVNIRALYGAAIFNPALSDNIRFIAKAGLAWWIADIDISSDYYGVYGGGTGSGIDPLFGIGIEFYLSDSFSIRTMFEQYTNIIDGVGYTISNGSTTISGETDGNDIDVIGISASLHF